MVYATAATGLRISQTTTRNPRPTNFSRSRRPIKPALPVKKIAAEDIVVIKNQFAGGCLRRGSRVIKLEVSIRLPPAFCISA